MTDSRTSKELLCDGHTTLCESLELASECHELAEERAENCDDEAATLLSKSGAILEMLVADSRYWRELYAREGHKSMVLQEELSKRPSHETSACLHGYTSGNSWGERVCLDCGAAMSEEGSHE